MSLISTFPNFELVQKAAARPFTDVYITIILTLSTLVTCTVIIISTFEVVPWLYLWPECSLRSSGAGLLVISRSRLKTKGDRASGVRAPQLWTEQPEEIRQASSVSFFLFFLFFISLKNCFFFFLHLLSLLFLFSICFSGNSYLICFNIVWFVPLFEIDQ